MGGFSTSTYEAAWRDGDFYEKETTDPHVSPDSCSGKSGNLYWRAFNHQLKFYVQESPSEELDSEMESHSFRETVESDRQRTRIYLKIA